jgi:hypothetical protein
VREKEALCPTAEFPYLRLGQAGDDRCEQHGSIHETSAVAGQDQVSTRITRCPVGVARARHSAVVENKGSGAESPYSYAVVEQIAAGLNVPVEQLIQKPELLSKVNKTAGAYTLNDILEELKKPGRDPRDKFVAPVSRMT